MSFKFTSNAPKCKKCTKNVYAQEQITYDNMVWHKSCFRCLSCQNVVSLKQVAVIRGDLYCKNCFMRMFSEKGTYHVFGQKTLPKAMLPVNADGSTPEQPETAADADAAAAPASAPAPVESAPAEAAPAPVSSDAAPEPEQPVVAPAPAPLETSASGRLERRSSMIKTCAVADCKQLRVDRTPYCADHASKNEPAPDESSNVALLHNFITSGSVADVQRLLDEHGAELALDQSQKKSALEVAFTSGAIACGQAIIEALAKRIKDLTEQVKDLEEENAENDFIIKFENPSPRNMSGEFTSTGAPVIPAAEPTEAAPAAESEPAVEAPSS